ncbi:MAG TPA: hypothetical protein VD838_05165 [Anaeromyxobacteraceae bacterium]|nr:hypothetical protein [Anaeromyxobacteraceae bacterium]
MFQPDPSIQFIPATREQVFAVVESINQPPVSLPGKPAQPVSGHLCGIRNGNGTFSIYVVLNVPRTGENVVYVHDRRQLGAEAYRDVEVEALQFLESMGFMLDNLNFRNLSAAVQDETLARIPAFSPPRAAPAAAGPHPVAREASPADASRVARLLASF